ncbi:MAG TPA: arsenate reductase ArsC, partial [Nitrospiraceae bacterium]|nr:arsenate reductase ArsC [Nitrospiraceae bacterium]
PAGLNPRAVQVMKEFDIDISQHRSKEVTEFSGSRFDYVITVCDRAKEACPIFPGGGKVLHWSFQDPAEADGSEEERMHVFRQVRDEIGSRVAAWLKTVP